VAHESTLASSVAIGLLLGAGVFAVMLMRSGYLAEILRRIAASDSASGLGSRPHVVDHAT
jgi:hypothetical protein